MMSKSFILCMLALLMMLPRPAGAEVLSWEECIRLTAEHNPTLVAAREKVRAAEAGRESARSARRPQLSASGSAEHAEQDGQTPDADASLSAGVNARQTLYSGGRIAASIETADAALQGARADHESASAEVTFRLRSAFVSMLHAQEQVLVLRRIVERRADNRELVGLRYEGGREHKGSLALSEASMHQARTELGQAERQVASSRQVLVRTMGLEGEHPALTVAGALEGGSAPEAVDWDAEAMRTPDYARAEASVRSAEASVRNARSGYRPDISLGGSAGRTGDTDAFDTDRWAVGVQLSFPFWSGGQTRAEVARARAQLSLAEAQRSETLNGKVSDLSELLVSFRNALENVDVQTRFFEASDLRAEIAREQYGAGLLSFDNWDVIENERISYQRRLLESQRAALLAEAAWMRATGTGVFDIEE